MHTVLDCFGEDVPCRGIPYLQTGSLVHVKMGPNILLVDLHGKSLVWQVRDLSNSCMLQPRLPLCYGCYVVLDSTEHCHRRSCATEL